MRVWQQNIEAKGIEIVATSDELPERPARRTEHVEFVDRESVFGACAPEIGEFSGEFVHNVRWNWLINTRMHINVARIEAHLPGIRRCNNDFPADELTPVHVIAECGGE